MAAASSLGADADRDELAAAARAHLELVADDSELGQVLADATADAYAIGAVAAARQLTSPLIKAADDPTAVRVPDATPLINWDVWQPGDLTASLFEAQGGLPTLLTRDGINGLVGIHTAALSDLGDRIADGLIAGDSVDEVAARLSDWVTGGRAERIAATEMNRAVTTATLDTYDTNDVKFWTLILTDGACQICVDAANGGPYKVEDQDNAPPLHPYCRCTAAPAAGGGRNVAIDTAGLFTAGKVGKDVVENEDDKDYSRNNSALTGEVLGDYTTDIQGRELVNALADQDVATDPSDLSAATDAELGAALAAIDDPTDAGQQSAQWTLLSELDGRDDDAAAAAGRAAGIAAARSGQGAVNPWPDTDERHADWQDAYEAALADPAQAAADEQADAREAE